MKVVKSLSFNVYERQLRIFIKKKVTVAKETEANRIRKKEASNALKKSRHYEKTEREKYIKCTNYKF